MLGISANMSKRALPAALKAGADKAPAKAAAKMVTIGRRAVAVKPAVNGSCLENVNFILNSNKKNEKT